MKVVIVAAKRTPIGAFLGAFAGVSAVELGATAARAVLEDVVPSDVTDVIVGNVLQAGLGMNPARQVALQAGLPNAVPGQTVNRVCGSGLQSLISATQALKAGDGAIYLAGGTENMSASPYLLRQARSGYRYGNGELVDSCAHDGLTDAFGGYAMGITAENVAAKWSISREDQDRFALQSQMRAKAAMEGGVFKDEIVPVLVSSSKVQKLVSEDEHPRPGTTLDALGKLKPAFLKENGTVTAGNSSGLNDGAAMLVVTTEEYARAHGLPMLVEVVAYSVVGVDPAIMGYAPALAVPAALKSSGLSMRDIDLFELNEAFAAQSIAVMRSLELDEDRVNLRGGAIALGHPIGASGTRVVVTLVHALRSMQREHGIASLCIGGGMGISVVLRNLA